MIRCSTGDAPRDVRRGHALPPPTPANLIWGRRVVSSNFWYPAPLRPRLALKRELCHWCTKREALGEGCAWHSALSRPPDGQAGLAS